MDKKCNLCGNLIPPEVARYPHSRFCSRRCRMKYNYKPLLNPALDTSRVGSVNEMLVAADLLKRGCNVFKALCHIGCDYAILFSGRLFLVEVTTGRKNINGEIKYPNKDHQRHDILAIVVDEEIFYKPSLEDILKTKNI